MSDRDQTVTDGDVIEFTLKGERRTAEAMLVTDEGVVLLDLFDGERPGWGRVSQLEDLTVYRPERTDALVAV
jgi:predicted RNA-binding protein